MLPALYAALRRRREPSILSRAIAYSKASRYSGTGALLDLSGNGHHAQLGSTAGADSNDPLHLPWAGVNYVYFPGTAGNSLDIANAWGTLYYQRYDPFGALIDESSVATNPVAFSANYSVSRIVLRSGSLTGTIVGAFDANDRTRLAQPFTSYTDAYGNVWTLNRSASGRRLAVVDAPMLLPGVDDYARLNNAAGPLLPATGDFTILTLVRPVGNGGDQYVFSQYNSNPGRCGLYFNSSLTPKFFVGGNGTDILNAEPSGPALTSGVDSVIAARRKGNSFQVFKDGVGGTAATYSSSIVQDAENLLLSLPSATRCESPWRAYAVLVSALSDVEIARASAELLAP